MFVVVLHDDQAPNSNYTGSEIFGPYEKEEAQAVLTKIVDKTGDQLFQIRDLQPGFAGYKEHELEEAGRDTNLAANYFAEIIPLTAIFE